MESVKPIGLYFVLKLYAIQNVRKHADFNSFSLVKNNSYNHFFVDWLKLHFPPESMWNILPSKIKMKQKILDVLCGSSMREDSGCHNFLFVLSPWHAGVIHTCFLNECIFEWKNSSWYSVFLTKFGNEDWKLSTVGMWRVKEVIFINSARFYVTVQVWRFYLIFAILLFLNFSLLPAVYKWHELISFCHKISQEGS